MQSAQRDDRDIWDQVFQKYHTLDELLTSFDKLDNPRSAFEREILSQDPNIQLFKLKKQNNQNDQNKLKVFIIFGQHAREMITTEVGLNILKYLNNDKTLDKHISPKINPKLLKFVKNNIDLQIIPVGNPNGKKQVDSKQSCWRSIYSTNPQQNMIDPNRNWLGTHKISSQEDIDYDANGDTHPFSITETQKMNEAIKNFDPDIFLDIHSGMKGLMYPNGAQHFENDSILNKDLNLQEAKKIQNKLLQQVKQTHCQGCLVGEAWKTIKYDSFGSAIDHNFFINDIPLSSVWEIYGDNSTLRMLNQNMRLMKASKIFNPEIMRLRKLMSSGKSSIAYKIAHHMRLKKREKDQFDCFKDFNPNLDDYENQVNNWTDAILKYMQQAFQLKDQLKSLKNKIRSKKKNKKLNMTKNVKLN